MTLFELLVALPLSVAVGALAMALLLHTTRQARALINRTEALDRLESAQLILRAELAPLQAADVTLAADTLLELQARAALLRVCAAPHPMLLEVTLPISAGDHPPSDVVGGLRAGDSLIIWSRGVTAGEAPIAARRRLQQAPTAMSDAPCTDFGGETRMERRWSLRLDADAADSLVPLIGAPVDVRRTVRFRNYRRGTSWWLGRQTRSGAGWESIQPAVGPLASPAQGGTGWTLMAQPVVPLPGHTLGHPVGFELLVRVPREAVGVPLPRTPTLDTARTIIELMGAPPWRAAP